MFEIRVPKRFSSSKGLLFAVDRLAFHVVRREVADCVMLFI